MGNIGANKNKLYKYIDVRKGIYRFADIITVPVSIYSKLSYLLQNKGYMIEANKSAIL